MAKPALASVNVHEAKTHLSRLLARIEKGEEIVIARNGDPIAKLVPFRKQRIPTPNKYKGLVEIPDDFDEMSEEDLKLWGM